jgi:endothelin-converting enzyme
LRDDRVLSQENPGIVLQTGGLEDSEHVWPPWPWPPWDEEGDDDDSDDGREGSPGDPFQNARELAQKVVQFETEIADATLDL